MTTRDHDGGDGPTRRKVLECMTWTGTGVLWAISGAAFARPGRSGAGRRAERLHLPADQRQPYGFRQAGQSERQGHTGGGDRPHQGVAGHAGFHDPHRRHHASLQRIRIRRRREDHRPGQARRRLDYINAKPVAAIVYRRRVHIINLFCAPAPGSGNRAATMESLQGYNLRRWSENGINLWAVTTSVPTNSASSARNSRRR